MLNRLSSHLCWFSILVLVAFAAGNVLRSGLHAEFPDESRSITKFLAANQRNQQLLISTWLPPLRYHEFAGDLAACCQNAPQYWGGSAFLCVCPDASCLSAVDHVESTTRIRKEWKFDFDALLMSNQSQLFLARVHTLLQTNCEDLIQAGCSCEIGGTSARSFHHIRCTAAELSMLLESPLVGHAQLLPTTPKAEFASKDAKWITVSGGDSPAPFVAAPLHFREPDSAWSRVSLADGRPQLDHAMFSFSNISLIPLTDFAETSFHGTHLCGVISGSPASGGSATSYAGITPRTPLTVIETNVDALRAGDSWRVWSQANAIGAAVHVDPWGTVPELSSREPLYYTAAAYEVDEFFWRHPEILNVRPLGTPSNLRGSIAFDESSSKNALIVGSSFTNTIDLIEQLSMFFPPVQEPACIVYDVCANVSMSVQDFCNRYADHLHTLMPHDRWFCRYLGQASSLSILAYSGRADPLFSGLYLADGRVRPHVVFPGTSVVSALPGLDSPLGAGSGASVSAAVAGAASAVLLDFLQSSFVWPEFAGYNLSSTARIPAALTRALHIAGAHILSFDSLGSTSLATLPENPSLARTYAGYGRPQLNLMMPRKGEFSLTLIQYAPLALVSLENGAAEPISWCYDLVGGQPSSGVVHAALTWADPPTAFLSAATMANQLRLSVRESGSGLAVLDTVQSGNEQVLSIVPASSTIEISVSAIQIVHNSSFFVVVLTSPGLSLSERPCPQCTPGTKTPCSVPGGSGEASCNAAGFPGQCRVSTCTTGRIPTSSTASCRTLPSMFILTTVVSVAFLLLLVVGLLGLSLISILRSSRHRDAVFSRWTIFEQLRTTRFLLNCVAFFSTLSALLASYSSFLTSSGIDKAQDPTLQLSAYSTILIAVICTNIGQIAASVLTSFLQLGISAYGSRNLRKSVIAVFAEQQVLDVVINANQNAGDLFIPCSTVIGIIPQMTVSLTSSLSKLFIGAIILFALDWQIAFAAVGCVLLLATWTIVASNSSRTVSKFYVRRKLGIHNNLVSSFSLLDWIQASNIPFARLYKGSLGLWNHATFYSNVNTLVTGVVASGLVELTAVAVFVGALRALQLGELTFGLLVVFFQWMSQSIAGFQGVMDTITLWSSFVGNSSGLLKHLRLTKRDTTGDSDLSITPMISLETKSLGFHYPSTTIGFENVSLQIAPQKLCMLMGPSGVGKSSFLRILVRITEPDSGLVLLDGKDLHSMKESSVFAALTLIEQDVMLKRGTLMQNVCIGLQEESGEIPEHILHLSDSIGAASWIAGSPLGWQTQVTSGGTNLSGGQRKLIGILRAAARECPIILADEVTSGLDPSRAVRVMKSLTESQRTILMTTHQSELVGFASAVFTLSKSGAQMWQAPENHHPAIAFTLGAARLV